MKQKRSFCLRLLPFIAVGILGVALWFTCHPGVVRMHVIANSDSAYDQSVKLAVRDALLEHYGTALGADDPAVLTQQVRALQTDMLATCRDTLDAQNCDADVSLAVATEFYPRREYGGKVYPAGLYRGVKVIIGEGAGQNWWCVIYPPLCLEEDAQVESRLMQFAREWQVSACWEQWKEAWQNWQNASLPSS